MDSTRRRVADSILRHGPSTAPELAARLEMTAAGIRRHLSTLTADGTLTVRDRRIPSDRGRGRPAKEYVLTDAGRAEFHQGYDELAISILDFLAQAGGDGAVEKFAAGRARRLEERFLEIKEAEPQLHPTDVLARALSDEGFVATTSQARTGQQVCQHHCPVAHVAAAYPQLCQAETEAIGRMLGSHVQRLATIAHGDALCTTHIPHPTVGGEK
ncbi:MAG: helix-turn-helix transcriptional regulator [Propionibacteriaceae bacterium]